MPAMQTNFQKTSEWLRRAGKVPGDAAAISVQIGVHLEEFAEFIDSIDSTSLAFAGELVDLTTLIKNIAGEIKRRDRTVYIADPLACLDALCDTDVTGNGVAYLAGFNKDGADDEVHRSNFSKFNADGSPVILPGGKVGKSELYTPPNLDPYL